MEKQPFRITSLWGMIFSAIGFAMMGVLIDLLSGQDYTDASFYSGTVIALGVAISMVLEKWLLPLRKSELFHIL